ncbi:MAG: hypothetical protein KAI24_05990 [Planctomycetes bacterium]|nr:hypothetical protein [Planctomycetota bacterium]
MTTAKPRFAASLFVATLFAAAPVQAQCLSMNENTTEVPSNANSNQRCYKFVAPHNMVVQDFQFYTRRTQNGNVTVGTFLYLENAGGGPTATHAASGTTTVSGQTPTWYTANLSQPVTLVKDEVFYLALGANTTVCFPHVANGDTTEAWTRSSQNWSINNTEKAVVMRVMCDYVGTSRQFGTGCVVQGQTPDTRGLVPANINQTAVVRGRRMPPAAAALCYMGFSDSVYSGFALPFPLDVLGAPTCSAYVSLDISYSHVTDSQGKTTTQIPIPNDPSLVLGKLYFQHIVIDPNTNALGLGWSNAVEMVIGGTP